GAGQEDPRRAGARLCPGRLLALSVPQHPVPAVAVGAGRGLGARACRGALTPMTATTGASEEGFGSLHVSSYTPQGKWDRFAIRRVSPDGWQIRPTVPCLCS